jgi:hypothetical protein
VSTSKEAASGGIGMGSAFAMILSWTTWHSFWWAVLHGILSWFYVGYYFLIANYDKVAP